MLLLLGAFDVARVAGSGRRWLFLEAVVSGFFHKRSLVISSVVIR